MSISNKRTGDIDMFRNFFSSRTSDLYPKNALEPANECLRLASKEDDPAKALELTDSAKSLLKDVENIFPLKKVKNPALSEGIAHAYREHGTLLDALGHHDKAMKSYSKAEKWGYVDATGRNTGSSHSLWKSDTIRRSLLVTSVLMHQDSSKADDTQINNQDHTFHVTPAKVNIAIPTPENDDMRQKIFGYNIIPPITKFALPEADEWITSTPQLAYCLSLLHPSMISKEELDQSERDWLQARVDDTNEQERLQSMATDLIRAFDREGLKKSSVVTEAVSLVAVLEQEDFRKLLQVFVDGISQSLLLDVHLLNGLAQLIRNAPQGYIDADDLVKILELLSTRLKDTHKQSTEHTYRLALTISQVLDSMVDSQVKGLSHEQLHEPLSDYLEELQQNPDPYLVNQAAYAYQALQYIQDDETILQSMIRRTGKVVQGISGVVSAVKALDLIGFIGGLQNVQQGLSGAEKAIGLVNDAYLNAVALAANGQGLLTSLKEGFNFKHKGSWYPALRGLDRLIQDGRFSDFEKLVQEAPCQNDPAFRLGVCQRLGEIAVNPIWDSSIRKCAVEFLRQLYKDDANNGQQVNIKQRILYILSQVAESSNGILDGSTRELLQEAQANSNSGKGNLHHGYENDIPLLYSTIVSPPPTVSPLLDRVQCKIDVETPLRQLKGERLKDRGGDVHIPPRAKATQRATDHFDLTTKVQEFLDSDRKVFLVLGDSGAGKSTFNRALEINLWDNYNKVNGRIPLFIHLPAIKKPERDLIAEKLRKVNFTEGQILELKLHREFILICDGYDESRQTRNLYMSNRFNKPGQWRVQMVISCRTEYNGVEYKDLFQPIDRNDGGGTGQFQEAIISPFTKEQIQDYIGQYVSLKKSSWSLEDYLQALEQIPNLQGLVKNPFLLKLAMEVLPQLVDLGKDVSSKITRIDLYDMFVAQWTERSMVQLMRMTLTPRDKEAFKILLDSGFMDCSINYLKELATKVYYNKGGNLVIDYKGYRDRGTSEESFLNDREGKNLLREAIPIVRDGDQYRFIHKSVLEYGLALAIYDPNIQNHMSVPSRSFENLPSTERTAAVDGQPLLDSPLGKRNLVRERSVLQFLTERAQQEPVFKYQLHSVIERSKTDEAARTAAANAITILVRAGVQFNSADLRNIKILGADLSFGMFDSAQLEGADLRNVDLRNVWMRQANLRGAQVKGIQLGELPFLKEVSSVRCCTYSPDGKTFVAGLDNGDISLYETSSWDCIRTLVGHDCGVNSLSFSATSGQMVSGSNDSTVRLWDVETGECIHALHGHSDYVHSVICSPKRGRIASGSSDSTVRLWDVDTGECIHTLHGHSSYVTNVVYSPKGDRIASGSSDSTVRLWDVDTGECIHILQGHSGGVSSVVYSPNGDWIASGSSDSTVRLWNANTGECIQTLQGHSDNVCSVVYSPKGDRIASGSSDKTVRLWDVYASECVRTFRGHSGSVGSVTYSPEGDWIASGSSDSTVRLWDVETGECIHTLHGHSDYVRSVTHSPSGDRIISGGYDSTVRLWDVDTGEYRNNLRGHREPVTSVVYSPKGDRVASGSSDNSVRLWDVDTGECIHTLQGHSDNVCSVVYSPKGDRIASGSSDKTVRLWDVDTGECIHTLQGHSDNICSVVYSPKSDRIASGSSDNTVRLWDADTGECIETLQGHSGYVASVVYSPKGDRIASGSYDKTVRLWDADTGGCIHILRGHSNCIRIVAYSPKGNQIASGSHDTTIRLWDADTGECVHTLQGHINWIRTIAYSPKGDQVVSGSDDNTVRLWDADTGKCIHTLQGHSSWVRSVVYSPKGDWIASGSDDRTLRLWDAGAGKCFATVSGFSDLVSSIAFGAQCLVTGSFDKSVRHWRIIEVGDLYKATLCWSSSHEALTACDVSLQDVQDLSQLNQKLLIQRGALVLKPLSSRW